MMNSTDFQRNFTADNNGYPLEDPEVTRLTGITPTKNQIEHAGKPFYAFIHFGMNTATDREWGSGHETAADFTVDSIYADQWVRAIKASGATGIILTCKHHDGFCLWDTSFTDFSVMHSPYGKDIVRQVSDACRKENLDFGVYLSPWDMHEKKYGTPEYNDYFCGQLTELLTGYGDIFEVWFDGAKGENAVDFEYDWNRYYELIRRLMPCANIAICGPDIRWVGNEAGKARKTEYSVVPEYLTRAETVHELSQHSESEGSKMKQVGSRDEDLGSRELLKNTDKLHWYPAEVDVSIRDGWFFHEKENDTVKSADELFRIYLTSVGNNCSLLLNIPPSNRGVIHDKDVEALRRLGEKIEAITADPVLELHSDSLSDIQKKGYMEFEFNGSSHLSFCVIEEDISKSQRVEAFSLFVKNSSGEYEPVFEGTVIGSKKIITLDKEATGAAIVIRQSRSLPYLGSIGFYR